MTEQVVTEKPMKVWVIVDHLTTLNGKKTWVVQSTHQSVTQYPFLAAANVMADLGVDSNPCWRARVYGDAAAETACLALYHFTETTKANARAHLQDFPAAQENPNDPPIIGKTSLFPESGTSSARGDFPTATGDGGNHPAEPARQTPLFGAAEEDTKSQARQRFQVLVGDGEITALRTHIREQARRDAIHQAQHALIEWAQGLERAKVAAEQMADELDGPEEWYRHESALALMAHAASGFAAAYIGWQVTQQ